MLSPTPLTPSPGPHRLYTEALQPCPALPYTALEVQGKPSNCATNKCAHTLILLRIYSCRELIQLHLRYLTRTYLSRNRFLFLSIRRLSLWLIVPVQFPELLFVSFSERSCMLQPLGKISRFFSDLTSRK